MPKHERPSPRALIAITFFAFIAVLFVFFSQTAGGQPIAFSKQGLQNVTLTFAPLVAIAAFIERAVEVVISTWRGPQALALKQAIDTAEAGDADPRPPRDELQHYKLETQSYAFAVSLGLSLCASLVGVRGVSPLVDAAQTVLSPRQHLGFTVLDVTLTALLLAGGCDGIHQVVTTITRFLTVTKDKMTP